MTSRPSGPIRPTGLLYAVDEWPPPVRLALIGLQFAVMMAIYLVLVAIILRHTDASGPESVALLGIAAAAAAVGASLQAINRGPIGSGFLAPPVYSATYLAPSIIAAHLGGMPLVFGMTIFAGIVEVSMALMLVRLRFIVTPVLSGLTVFVVGLQLGVVGIGEMLDVQHELLPSYHQHLMVTILTLAVCVGLSIWGRGSAELLCSLAGLLAGMGLASIVGLFDPVAVAALHSAAWVSLPHPALLQYKFEMSLIPAFLAAGVAASLRAVGVVTTCQRLNDANWRRPDMVSIRKGVLADGMANIVGGALGAPGMNIAPSLVGISSVTGATSRVIAYAAAAILLCVALSPKLAAFMLLVPSEVAGSMLVFTASFMISGGMAVMLSRPADTRAIYVIGVSTLLTLSENVFPGYFHELTPFWRSVTDSPLAFGLGVAILLTLLFRFGTSQAAEVPLGGDARGDRIDPYLPSPAGCAMEDCSRDVRCLC